MVDSTRSRWNATSLPRISRVQVKLYEISETIRNVWGTIYRLSPRHPVYRVSMKPEITNDMWVEYGQVLRDKQDECIRQMMGLNDLHGFDGHIRTEK